MDDMMESDLEACVVVMSRRVTTDEDQFCWQCRWLNTSNRSRHRRGVKVDYTVEKDKILNNHPLLLYSLIDPFHSGHMV